MSSTCGSFIWNWMSIGFYLPFSCVKLIPKEYCTGYRVSNSSFFIMENCIPTLDETNRTFYWKVMCNWKETSISTEKSIHIDLPLWCVVSSNFRMEFQAFPVRCKWPGFSVSLLFFEIFHKVLVPLFIVWKGILSFLIT